MSFILFIKIFFICLFGAMSPGPSMLVIINKALESKLNGFMASVGHGLGIGIYALFAVIGLELLSQNFYNIFFILKIISIIFLFYLGISSFLDNKVNQKITKKQKKIYNYHAFADGFVISILNPKIFIFFTAIYSQFISQENDNFLNFTLVMTATIVDTLWYLTLTILVAYLHLKKISDQKVIMVKKIVGLLFIFISIALTINLFL